MTEVDQDKATRYHEAAHAVFAVRVCGGEVRYVDADEAYCAFRLTRPYGLVDYWGEALLSLAGEAAAYLAVRGEMRFRSWAELSEIAEMEDEEDEEDLVRSDSASVHDRLCDVSHPEEEYRAMVEETEKTVRELWPEITAVAEALGPRRRLEGEEVARLIETVDGEETA